MNEKVIFGSLIGAVAILLLVAVLRPAPEPLTVQKTDDDAALTDNTEAEATAPEADTASSEDTAIASESAAEEQATSASKDETEETAEATTAPGSEEKHTEDAAVANGSETNITGKTAPDAAPDSAENGESKSDDVAALTARIEELERQLLEATEKTSAKPQASEETAQQSKTVPEEQGVGETTLLEDGALRVFASRINEDGARLSINGKLVTLMTGEQKILPVGDTYCGVTLDSTSGNKARVSALCGRDLPPPEGIGVGETAILANGALRVFVSSISDKEARLSINGTTARVAVDRSVRVTSTEQPCRVMLNAIDRRKVQLNHVCGTEAGISDAIRPGATAILNDGAVRVFVSSINDESVRFAVNGQSVQSAEAGSEVELAGGCTLNVGDIEDRSVNFGIVCD